MRAGRWVALALVGFTLGVVGGREAGHAQSAPGPKRPAAPAQPHAHGTPKGWRFAWPKGDSTKGREVFQRLECFTCHEVLGERFPPPSNADRTGPELSVMGSLHSPEFLAESIINPNAVVERSKGYAATDGSSKMPSYNDSLTIQETIDLVAYLRQLRPPAGAAPGHGGHATP